MAMKFEVSIFWVMTPCSDDVAKMKAARCTEMLVSYHITTRTHDPEDHDLKKNLRFPKNAKASATVFRKS
jgi:hypothetical protein